MAVPWRKRSTISSIAEQHSHATPRTVSTRSTTTPSKTPFGSSPWERELRPCQRGGRRPARRRASVAARNRPPERDRADGLADRHLGEASHLDEQSFRRVVAAQDASGRQSGLRSRRAVGALDACHALTQLPHDPLLDGCGAVPRSGENQGFASDVGSWLPNGPAAGARVRATRALPTQEEEGCGGDYTSA